jgi:hypothetical protein
MDIGGFSVHRSDGACRKNRSAIRNSTRYFETARGLMIPRK